MKERAIYSVFGYNPHSWASGDIFGVFDDAGLAITAGYELMEVFGVKAFQVRIYTVNNPKDRLVIIYSSEDYD